LDIDAFNVDPAPEWRAAFSERWRDLHVELWEDDRPLVVAHTGAAVGAGSALLFASDIAISGRSAFAHVVETALGMLAPINIAWLVARHTPALAAELALLAERVGAERLHGLGVVSEVVDDEAVLERALDRAQRLAGFPRAPIAATRRALRDLSGVDFTEMIAAAQAHGQGLGGPRRQER
jgi:2-(1,2-epoxy-1,2-dihydrophenyl)acetyl-CoA isomerase